MAVQRGLHHFGRIAQDRGAQRGFAGLRQLETRLPEALAQLKEESQRVRPELDAAAAHIDQLSTRYADSALQPLREDLGQARERLRFADDMAAAAEEAARGDDRLGGWNMDHAVRAWVESELAEENPHAADWLGGRVGRTGLVVWTDGTTTTIG